MKEVGPDCSGPLRMCRRCARSGCDDFRRSLLFARGETQLEAGLLQLFVERAVALRIRGAEAVLLGDEPRKLAVHIANEEDGSDGNAPQYVRRLWTVEQRDAPADCLRIESFCGFSPSPRPVAGARFTCSSGGETR